MKQESKTLCYERDGEVVRSRGYGKGYYGNVQFSEDQVTLER